MSEAPAPDFTSRRLVGGILLGTGLAVCGIAVALVGRGGREALHAAPPPDLGSAAIAVLCAAIDIWLGGYRLYYMARRLAPEVRPLDGLRAELANRCLAGITPFQTGGGPAQLYVLARAGLRVSAGVAVGTINFLVATLVLIGFGIVALAFLPESLPGWLRVSTFSTLGALVVLVALGVLVLAKGRLPVTRGGGGNIRNAIHRVVRVARRSLEIAREFLRAEPRAVLGLFPITIALLAAKAVTTYFVFRAFEPQGHFQEMVGVLVIFILSLFFAPTPGATGVAEGAGTAFLVGSLGTAASVGFVLTWRALTLYVPVLIGGFVLLHQFGRDARRLGRLDTSEAPN